MAGFYNVEEMCSLDGELFSVAAEGEYEHARQEAEKTGTTLTCYVSVGHYNDPHAKALGTLFEEDDWSSLVELVQYDISLGFSPCGSIAQDIKAGRVQQ